MSLCLVPVKMGRGPAQLEDSVKKLMSKYTDTVFKDIDSTVNIEGGWFAHKP